jgi:hypothetical protein
MRCFTNEIPKSQRQPMYHQRDTKIAAPTVVALNLTAPAVTAIASTPMRMSIKKAHDMLGDINEKAVRKTTLALGWELTKGTLGVCEPCTETTAK